MFLKTGNIKLSPLGLFLLLLVILMGAVILQRWFPWLMPTASSKEGYISFYGNTPMMTSASVVLPMYSSTSRILKMYDNLFFDPLTGNVIVAEPNQGQSQHAIYTSGTDSSGTSIASISVYSRIPNHENNAINPTESFSTTTPSPCSYTMWAINTPIRPDIGAQRYVTNWRLLYMPYGTDKTIMHVIDTSGSRHLCSYIASAGSIYKYPTTSTAPGSGTLNTSRYVDLDPNANFQSVTNIYTSATANNQVASPSSLNLPDDPSNNKVYVLSSYDTTNQVHQLAQNILFDPARAFLFTKDSNNQGYSVANGSIPPVLAPKPTAPFTTYGSGPNVVYMKTINAAVIAIGIPNTSITGIAVLDSKSIWDPKHLYNAVWFDTSLPPPYSIGMGQMSTHCSNPSPPPPPAHTPPPAPKHISANVYDIDETIDTNVYDFNNIRKPSRNHHLNYDDYLLKSQVVPPVCPVCPTCPTCPTCPSCGTNNPVSKNKYFIADTNGNLMLQTDVSEGLILQQVATKQKSLQTDQNGNIVIVDVKKVGPVNNAINTTGDIIKTGEVEAGLLAAGAGSAVYKGVEGGANLLTKGVEGGANLLTQGVQGGVGLAKDTVSGAVGLAKDTVSGAVGLVAGGGGGGQGGPSNNQRNSYYNSPYSGGPNNTTGQGGGPYNSAGPNSFGPTVPAQGQNMDPYSYYGAVPTKGGSNFMPVTADFSKFGR